MLQRKLAATRVGSQAGVEYPSRTVIKYDGGGTMDRITVNPKIHFGKPSVVGTRITVQSVLELLSEGLSFSDIIQDYYPDL